MPAHRLLATVLSLLFSIGARAQNGQSGAGNHRIDPLPRDLEVQLARSALPRHLRDSATVYVLNPGQGFEVAQKGTNGFHAFVARTGDDAFRGSWPFKAYRDDILYPVSFDEAGSRANMRVFFDAAETQAKGTPPEQLKKLIQERYKTGFYKPPDRPGVSYMMAPILRTDINPEENDTVRTTINPHVMHYVPNLSNRDVGAATPAQDEVRHLMEHGRWKDNPDPFVIMPGPHGYMVQFLGVTERAAIEKEYQEMLGRLCRIKKVWCLSD